MKKTSFCAYFRKIKRAKILIIVINFAAKITEIWQKSQIFFTIFSKKSEEQKGQK